MSNLQINEKRLWNTIMETAKIGGTVKGGICRQSLTDADGQVRDWFVKTCEKAGCAITIDEIGNIFARRPGKDKSRPPIAIGSHLDTQPSGGKFDGALGVLSGIEVLHTLNDANYTTTAPLEVIDWTNEEGSRFSPPMMGSGVFTGVFEHNFVYESKCPEGRKFKEELERIGYLGKKEKREHKLGAYFELHIEQGPVLEAESKTIGVVTGVQGMSWFYVTVIGKAGHASTPMQFRKDALLSSARLFQSINMIAFDHAPLGLSTVGMVVVKPNSLNVIPESVLFSVDLRHPEDAILHQMEKDLELIVNTLSIDLGMQIKLEKVHGFPAVKFNEGCIDIVRTTAKNLGYSYRDIISGAGHDAVYLSRITPTAMIFVPCKNGISHNELEQTELEHVAAGANVLLNTVIKMDGITGE